MSRVLNVLYQSDDNYAMVSGISIASLLENNKHLDKINIYYCSYKIIKKNQERLNKLVKKYSNCSIFFLDGTKYHNELVKLNVRSWHGVYVTWLKLLALGDINLSNDRIVFINGHTIINSHLDYFIDYKFGNNIMACAYDCLTNDHKETIGLTKVDGYFNCGVMLINHKLWVTENTSKFIKDHLRKKSDYLIADQDLCNVIFKGRIGLLDCGYNFPSSYYAYNVKRLLKVNDLHPDYFYSYETIMESYYSPRIIHSLFGIKGKPWEIGSEHPQRYLWSKYLSMTPWSDIDRGYAKRNLLWYLYDTFPSWLFMILYGMSTRSKFGR